MQPGHVFSDMPSLTELERQIAQIRAAEPLWGDPRLPIDRRTMAADALQVLRHYDGSIDELASIQQYCSRLKWDARIESQAERMQFTPTESMPPLIHNPN
ncbi:MAG: hypothetical protein AAF709_08955 [Pseudomonadota bacterium]